MQATNPLPAESVPRDAEAPARAWRGFMIRAALSVALLGVLLWRYGGSAALGTLARERVAFFIAAIAVYLAGQLLSAYRWRLLTAVVGLYTPFREILAYYLVGMFTNLFAPGLIGGDAARTLYLGRRHARLASAAATVIADRAVGLLALFWLAAAVAFRNRILPATVTRPIVLIGLFALASYLVAPIIARVESLMPHVIRRYAELITPYMRRPATLIPALLLSLALQLSLVICQYLLSLGMGLKIPFAVFLLCVPIANVVASVPITLAGLGLREGTYAVLFAMAGLSRADAVALGLLMFAATMLGGLPGIVPFLTTDIPPLRAPKSAGEAA